MLKCLLANPAGSTACKAFVWEEILAITDAIEKMKNKLIGIDLYKKKSL